MVSPTDKHEAELAIHLLIQNPVTVWTEAQKCPWKVNANQNNAHEELSTVSAVMASSRSVAKTMRGQQIEIFEVLTAVDAMWQQCCNVCL